MDLLRDRVSRGKVPSRSLCYSGTCYTLYLNMLCRVCRWQEAVARDAGLHSSYKAIEDLDKAMEEEASLL
jgi:hypothetical protein